MSHVRPIFLALGLFWPVLHAGAASAQTSAPVLDNSDIEITYVKPGQPYLMPIYERLKKRGFLEQLKQLLSPLQLPVKLRITTYECGVTNSFWNGRAAGLSLCYEWPDWLERLAPIDKTPEGYRREDIILGAFLQVTFHELGHGMFDIYNVPMFGREEDAADQMAGFMMWQFGEEVARRTLPGSAYFWRQSEDGAAPWSRDLYSDTHGNPMQRYYNILCMAYGRSPETFKEFVDTGMLPKERAALCPHEYQQIRNAFVKTILPHIDPVMMKEVQSRQWLQPDDGK
jgi:hypothetical protein